MKKHSFFLLISLGVLLACSDKAHYDKYAAVPENGWNQDSILVFNVPIEDTGMPYDFYVNVRNSVEYRYSNIYFFIETVFPSGEYLRDTVEFLLADRDGKWFGNGWGKIKENQFLLRKDLKFPLPGNYQFRFEQAMRKENLQGMEDIGLRIVPSEPMI